MLYEITDPKFIALVEKGVPLDELEKRLRPSASSEEGFLGSDERLLEVVHSDWRTVERYRTSHEAIVHALEKLIAGNYPLHPDYEFMEPSVMTTGVQDCPWGCRAYGQNAGLILRKGLSEDERSEAKYAEMGGINEIGRIINSIAERFGENAPMLQQYRRIQENSRKERELFYAPLTGLLPHLIGVHYFFEGRKSPYRADPSFLIHSLSLADGK